MTFAAIIFANESWLWPVAAAVVVLSAALIWADARGVANGRARLVCGALKLAGIILLALILLDPLRVSQRARPGANIFALIADNSQSLQMKDAGEPQSRGEVLRKTLAGDAGGWQSALEENFQVRRYAFDSRLQSAGSFGELNFSGRASALGGALKTAVENWRGQPVAGVLLFTDGNTTDIGADLPALAGCPPVYPVVLGSDKNLTDVALEKVAVSQTAFEDAPVTIQASVAANGFSGQEIAARLTEIQADGKAARAPATQLTQRASGDDLNFRFQIQPEGNGLHFYELEARSRGELENSNAPSREATLINNRQVVVVDRGQEPLRVLYVSGRPNWEFKFLNRAIQEDAQVKMVSLIRVARREPKFQFKGAAGESSNPLFSGFGDAGEDAARYDQPVVIRLNTRDEFELRGGFPKTAEELFQYQAVIVAKLEAEFFTHEQQALLQRFVSERGGGFLMLGGAESFREGGYAGTPIGSMLPVYLDRPPDATLTAMWKLTLTREGWLQPWTRLRATEDDEKARLAATQPHEVINPASGVKPGASVLATVSDPSGRAFPALAAQRFGAGRTAALMVGDLWLGSLRDETMQKDLAKSWRQLVRWLVSDVPQKISVAAEPAADGDSAQVRLVVKAHDAEFKPLDGAAVRLTIRPVAAGIQNSTNGAAGTNYLQLTAEPSAQQPGVYEASYVAREAGAYSVDATVTLPDGKVAGRAVAGWSSDPAAAEFRELKPNRALMESLARKTGGEVVALDDLGKFVRGLPARRAPVTETWTEPLWHKPSVFLLALACFVAEWGIRRWKGMP